MSMNIHFQGTREILVLATGLKEKQVLGIPVWQTPTDITYNIVESDNPVKAYAKWAAGQTGEETEPVYAEDDIWNEGEPIGTRTYNLGRLHAAEFLRTVRMMVRQGYIIQAFAM